MAGRSRLRGGFSRWLPDHRRADGHVFRRYVRAGLELLGGAPLHGAEVRRLAVQHYATAGVVYEQAARAWAAAVAQRERGRGRRPSSRQVERAARRLGLADQTLQAALARLEAHATQRGPADLAARFAAHHREAGRA